ncbi:hypothetical protein SOV_50820 [Sporomusa ovata DSM 2662]|uniref:hypothetical protein n=1 Tax=Sporomusa ovata TaxID=2378 RepID=UPI0003888D53|nr:hypothetical protein [Sporomusa ovata]EQB27455.1 hypothetical protein SOV_2c03510 [Sporomusa ovata DSM 2662]
MLTFPTDFPQPVIPEVESGSYKEDFKDSTVSSTTDANYKITRARASRLPGTWSYSWRGVPDADYKKLIDFWFAVGGTAGSFYFIPYYGPYAGVQKVVRFTAKGDWQPYTEGYRGSITFEEV